MHLRIQQGLVFVLAVEVHQTPAQLTKRRSRHEDTIDEAARASLGGDLAAHDEFAAVPIENGLNDRRFFACPHDVRGGPVAEQQADRADHDRLASASLARHDAEAGSKGHFEGFDHGQVADVQVRSIDVLPKVPAEAELL